MARAFLLMEALEAEDERQQAHDTALLRRNLRAQARALSMTDVEFKAHYRITKDLFEELCFELGALLSLSKRKTKISVECKVLTALSFYATGSYQKPVGMSFLHGLSQPSVSNAVREVTLALNNINILTKYIKFPQTQQERNIIINKFYRKFGIPGVLACVDGTHVALVKPSEHEERFFNRKHYHSRNVQIICDSDLNILNVDASFGGATHDAYIWRNSEINDHLQQLHRNGESIWFLGDSGYPLRPWLLTPIVNADPGSAEENYTNVHCSARNTVERCIGVLKARWRCLLAHRVLHYDHHTVAKIINACCVLHNIANKQGIQDVTELSDEDAQSDSNRQVAETFSLDNESQQLESGRVQRSLIVQRLWRERLRGYSF